MIKPDFITIMPYSRIVGQDDLKIALELAFISDQIRGVLISGHRGTGKSTAVRAFCRMIYGHLPITLPINATEDRVIGGWKIDELMRGNAEEQIGLLEQAKDEILYIDEINLLDDHIVNIILDVTATNILVILNFPRFCRHRVKGMDNDWFRTQPGKHSPELNAT